MPLVLNIEEYTANHLNIGMYIKLGEIERAVLAYNESGGGSIVRIRKPNEELLVVPFFYFVEQGIRHYE